MTIQLPNPEAGSCYHYYHLPEEEYISGGIIRKAPVVSLMLPVVILLLFNPLITYRSLPLFTEVALANPLIREK